MSEVNITKEKNIITMELPVGDKIRTYHLDVSTGMFTTKTGKPTTKIVGKFKLNGLNGGWGFIIEKALRIPRNNAVSLYAVVELLLSCGISFPKICELVGYCDSGTIEDILKYKKYLSKWLDKNAERLQNYAWWNEFLSDTRYHKRQAECGHWAKQLTKEQYICIYNKDHSIEISNDKLEIYAYYLLNNQYYNELVPITGYNDNIIVLTRNYLHFCKELDKKPKRCANALREFAETKRSYKAMKEIIDQRKFSANYEKHNKAWEFEYGDFTIIVPKKGKDLVREGQEMHNCVGSYVDKVVNGECSIVFVRHKDTPDKSYITCQVRPNGQIAQYYLAYNYYIKKDEDIAFKNAFQEHLNKIWNNN